MLINVIFLSQINLVNLIKSLKFASSKIIKTHIFKEIKYRKKFSKLVSIKVSNLPIFARLRMSKAVKQVLNFTKNLDKFLKHFVQD